MLRYMIIFFVVLILLVGIVPITAQQDTPELILGGGTGEIVYSRSAGSSIHIMVINTDGTDVRQLTDDSATDWTPDWSPDGQTIAFNRHTVGLHAIDADGSNLRQLTSEDDYGPDWSPDGTMLTFGSWRTDNLVVHVINLETEEAFPVTDTYSFSPSWSPDGETVVMCAQASSGTDLYRVDVNTSELELLYDLEGGCGFPSVSPDGKMIAFDSDGTIYVLNLATEETLSFTVDSLFAGAVVWSPDGEWLVFHVSEAPGAVCADTTQLYISDIRGENMQQVTTDGGCFPDWRPLPVEE